MRLSGVWISPTGVSRMNYRLNIFELRLPPLRERMEDLPILVDHFIQRLSALQDKGIRGIAPKALRVLMGHDFPGNVRELQNAVEHAFVLSQGTLIRTEYLPEGIRGGGDLQLTEGTTLQRPGEGLHFEDTRPERVRPNGDSPGSGYPQIHPLPKISETGHRTSSSKWTHQPGRMTLSNTRASQNCDELSFQ